MKKSEEQEVLRVYEKGDMKVRKPSKALLTQLQAASENTFRKDKRINIRISSRDLERIQRRAAREGVPYQTYISSSLHKLVTGQLNEEV